MYIPHTSSSPSSMPPTDVSSPSTQVSRMPSSPVELHPLSPPPLPATSQTYTSNNCSSHQSNSPPHPTLLPAYSHIHSPIPIHLPITSSISPPPGQAQLDLRYNQTDSMASTSPSTATIFSAQSPITATISADGINQDMDAIAKDINDKVRTLRKRTMPSGSYSD